MHGLIAKRMHGQEIVPMTHRLDEDESAVEHQGNNSHKTELRRAIERPGDRCREVGQDQGEHYDCRQCR